MGTIELRKKINKIVGEIDDKNFLVNLYDLLQNKANDKSSKDILDELTPKQLTRLKSSIKQLDAGKGISHEVAMARLKKLAR
jgi:hypothetical protein